MIDVDYSKPPEAGTDEYGKTMCGQASPEEMQREAVKRDFGRRLMKVFESHTRQDDWRWKDGYFEGEPNVDFPGQTVLKLKPEFCSSLIYDIEQTLLSMQNGVVMDKEVKS